MSEVLFGLFLLLLFGVRGWQFWRKVAGNRELLRSWQEDAAACGLQVLETSKGGPRLKARMESVAVTIDGQGDEDGRNIQIDVRFPGPPDFYTVSIRRESRVRRARDLEIGDPRFDSTFFLEGPMRPVLARLDAETRRLLILVNARGRLQISTDTIRVEHLPNEQIPYVLPLLLQIGQRLAQPIDEVARRLADNAHRDPEAGVRLRNLLLLLRELPEAPETREALRTACSDRSPIVRLGAARALGAEGRALLLELAESLEDDSVSAKAVSILDRELSFERMKAILDQALSKGLPKTAHACQEALGEKGASPGQLSMDGTEAGQLALAPDDAGQLSLAADPAGQISLEQPVSPFEIPSEEPEQPPHREREAPGGRRA